MHGWQNWIGIAWQSTKNYEEQIPDDLLLNGATYSTDGFAVLRDWQEAKRRARISKQVLGEHMHDAELVEPGVTEELAVIPMGRQGAPKRARRELRRIRRREALQRDTDDQRRQQRRRRIMRHRLNSSDDVVGYEEVSLTDTPAEEDEQDFSSAPETRHPPTSAGRRAERMERLAYRCRDTSSSSSKPLQRGRVRNPYLEDRQRMRADARTARGSHEAVPAHGQRHREPDNEPQDGYWARDGRRAYPVASPTMTTPMWTRVGQRWRLTLRTRGFPAHMQEVSILIDQRRPNPVGRTRLGKISVLAIVSQ